MNKSFKYFLLILFTYTAFIFFETACKKHDKFPSQSLPQITGINPSSALPGSSVVISGSNLINVKAVRFGTIEAVFQTPTDNSITTIVPDSLPAGNVYVQLYAGDGEGYAVHKFDVLQLPKIPTITSINPATAMPGDTVTLGGINFINVSSVILESSQAIYSVTNDAELKLTIPDDVQTGKQIITISSPVGSDTASVNIQF